jgi:hypothetical protein
MPRETSEAVMIRTLLVVCSLIVPAMAVAQTPVDWQMNVAVLDPGDRIDVRTVSGLEVRGRVVRFDAESITLERQGREAHIPASSVSRIDRHDSIWNGGAIGFGAGFATGATMMATCDPGFFCEHSASAILGCGALTGGFGFGVGLLFDALVHGDHTVFRRSEGGRVRLDPVITKTQRSLSVRVGF